MSKLFNPPSPPRINDKEIERERRRQIALRTSGAGRQSTILSGGAGITAPILGNAAALSGF